VVLSPESLETVDKLESKFGRDDPYDFDKTSDDRYFKVTFSALGSYDYDLPDPEEIRKSDNPSKPPVEQIPDGLKKLDEEQVVVVGFMVPIEIDRQGKVKSFALTQNQMFCCYGVPPAMNEWIMVDMVEGQTADFANDLPVAAYGQMRVGEEIDDGYVLSLYRLAAHEVIDAHELLKRVSQGK